MQSTKFRFLSLLLVLVMQVLPVAADDIPLRGQRREVFRACAVDPGTIVFLGNSITHFGLWPEMFGTDVKVVNRGISGNFSGEVADHLDYIVEGRPKKLFVMIGINDNNQPHVIIPNIRRIIQTTKRESPLTEIYIQSLLPCNRADRHGMVEPKNEEIKALCAEEGVTYIDVYSKLVDSSTTPPGIAAAFTNDNLHVIGAGYRAWVSDFEQYVGVKPVFASGDAVQERSLDTVENMLITQFQLLPVPDGAMLHIGDYNVKTGEWAELMNNTKFLNRGMGIGWGYTHTMQDLLVSVPHIVKGKPSKIFVQCGARDFANAATTTAWAYDTYKQAIDKIRALAPEAEIYMQSIIPFTDASLNERMQPFHEKIKALADADANDKLFFIDVYGALAENGVLAEKFRGANTAQSRGINGRGYVRWANCLNDASGSTMQPVAEQSDAQFALSEAVAEALRVKYSVGTGDEPGHYGEAAVAALGEAVARAKAVLADAAADEARLAAEAEALAAEVAKMADGIVLPKLSGAADGEHWYKLSTPRRDSKYLEGCGVGTGATGAAVNNYARQQWKFTLRTDGRWNVVNRADGTYLTPDVAANAKITSVTAEPAKGWTLKGVGASGTFIVTADGVQLHQTNAGRKYEIINWGGGGNTTDAGCLFKIESVTGAPDEEPAPEPAPESVLTLLDVTLAGDAPVEVPAEAAAPVLASKAVSVAIDFTLSANRTNAALVASSNRAKNEAFVSILVSDKSHMAVRYNNGTGVYTQKADIGTDRHRLVVVMQPEAPSYAYYLDGAKLRDVAAVAPILSGVEGVDGLFLGGVVCADNANKYPAEGTIHSVQFFPAALTAEQVAAINYDNLRPTGISGAALAAGGDAAGVYHLSGSRVTCGQRLAPGVYVEKNADGSARKVVVK